MARLNDHRDQVNRLNVFPVPDGDTGTNMLLTLQSALEEVEREDSDEIGRVAARAAHGSLMGARGNSGVILSQILRGFSHGVAGRREVDAATLASALRDASTAAYRAVLKPKEGTILSVAAAAAEGAAESASADADILSVMRAATEAAQTAVARTPEQLAILRQAGVVDAGGYGLQLILEGFLAGAGDDGATLIPKIRASAPEATVVSSHVPVGAAALELPEEGWGYCTEFLISDALTGVEAIRDVITGLGSSALVVGDAELVRVHVHTEDPGSVISYANSVGSVSKIKVEDMTAQHREVLRGEIPAPSLRELRRNGVGIVVVAGGEGIQRIFQDLGVDAVVQGGQTMNPSTEDLLRAVQAQPYDEVILLPNNANVILTAEQLVPLSRRKVRVVPTRTIPQGIAAVMAFSATATIEENGDEMLGATREVVTIEVTHAVRDTSFDGLRVRRGDTIALIDGSLSGTGRDVPAAFEAAMGRLPEDRDFEFAGIFAGAGAAAEDGARLEALLRARYSRIEVDRQDGGQELYPFILSLE